MPAPDYDPRYLAGILFFNRRDYFEAHEAWEALWLDHPGPDKKFHQALIQAAVALHHFRNGNVRGALKLYISSKNYMEPFGSPHLGLDAAAFWQRMETCFASLFAAPAPDRSIELDEELTPVITLDPPPESWPDPEQFVEADEE